MDKGSFRNAPLSRSHAVNDSRLLLNLIRSERDLVTEMDICNSKANNASSALYAWGTSEALDINETSVNVANLLLDCNYAQKSHMKAIEEFSNALQFIADQEANIWSIIRDRDILVSRLIKVNEKKGNIMRRQKDHPRDALDKSIKAQKELQSCETFLMQQEETLVALKRRVVKNALMNQMKCMGDAGAAMVEAAQGAMLLLNQFDSGSPQRLQQGLSEMPAEQDSIVEEEEDGDEEEASSDEEEEDSVTV